MLRCLTKKEMNRKPFRNQKSLFPFLPNEKLLLPSLLLNKFQSNEKKSSPKSPLSLRNQALIASSLCPFDLNERPRCFFHCQLTSSPKFVIDSLFDRIAKKSSSAYVNEVRICTLSAGKADFVMIMTTKKQLLGWVLQLEPDWSGIGFTGARVLPRGCKLGFDVNRVRFTSSLCTWVRVVRKAKTHFFFSRPYGRKTGLWIWENCKMSYGHIWWMGYGNWVQKPNQIWSLVNLPLDLLWSEKFVAILGFIMGYNVMNKTK